MMTSIITTLFLGLLGILTLFLVLRFVFTMLFGLYIFSKLTYHGLVSLGYRLKTVMPARVIIPKESSPERQVEKHTAARRPTWAFVTHCLIWGSCKSQEVEK